MSSMPTITQDFWLIKGAPTKAGRNAASMTPRVSYTMGRRQVAASEDTA